jgi:ankyrin repeat protein
MDSPVYQRALQQWTTPSLPLETQQSQPQSSQPSISVTQSSFTDEGYSSYHSGGYNTATLSPDLAQQQENLLVLPKSPSAPVHTRSVSQAQLPQRQNVGGIRRIVSDSKALTRGQSSGSKLERFSSFLGRINTSSRRSLRVSPVGSQSIQTTLNTRGRGHRLQANFHSSIDLAKDGASVSPLIKAAQAGSRDEAERLIELGLDIEERHERSGRNALLVASHCGKEAVVDLLIQCGARLAVTDGSGETPLHLAASRGHWEVMELLLIDRTLIETPNLKGRTALRVAADCGQPDSVQVLLMHHAQVNARAENQMTALHAAAKRGDSEIVQLLVAYGADVEAKDGMMMTALHYACEEGHLDAIRIFLEHRANIEAQGRDRKTPLICAAEAGRAQAVDFLLKRKASSRSTDDSGMTALHWAAYNGHEETVRILSEKKGLLDMVNSIGRTALHLAVIQSQFAVVEFLQRKGIPLETRCKTGLTALHYACMADSFEITRLLLLTGADVEASESQHQERPLHIVASRGSLFLLELLCEKGASLDARNGMGDRPVCVASRFGNVEVVQKLLDRGSPLSLKFGTGFREDSPLCLAAMGGHLHVASLLLARGASVLKKDEAGWQPMRYAAYHGQPELLQLLLSSGKIPDADIADIINMPDTVGFSPGVPEDRMHQVHQLLNQTLGRSLQRPSVPPPLTQYGVSQGESIRDSLSSIHTPSPAPDLPFPSVFEADSSTPFELPGSLDQDVSSPARSADISPRTATPESRPSIDQPPLLASDRVAALLRESRGSPPLRHQNRRPNGTRSRSRSQPKDTPLVSATFTPIASSSFISPPQHQSSSHTHRAMAYRVKDEAPSNLRPASKPIPPSEHPTEAERTPRTIPVKPHATSRAGSRARTHKQDAYDDSDSDSISSVYTAPEGEAGPDTSTNLDHQGGVAGLA